MYAHIRMRKHIQKLLLVLLTMPFALTSCMEDSEERVYSDKCYISSFSLGGLTRRNYTKTSQGEDSIFTTTFSGSAFTMTIDQRNLTIENLDSLPIRTRLDKVTTSAAFEGAMVWRKVNYENLEDTMWHSYNSSDSLDLTEPIHLCVVAENLVSKRIYTLKINVHQQVGDSTTWDNLGPVAALSGLQARKVVAWNGQLVVLGVNESGAVTCVQHALGTQGEWSAKSTTGAENADVESLQQIGDCLYLSTTDGKVIESTNATDWTPASFPTLAGLRLVAASDGYLYALAGGQLYSSNGETWDVEQLDDDASLLPTMQVNSAYYYMANGRPRLMLFGARTASDKQTTIWAKSWEQGLETQTKWIYYTPNEADKYRLPMMENLCVVPYDNGLQALGGRSMDGRFAALETILHSRDHGITWKTYENDDMVVDSHLSDAARTARYIVAAVDEDNFLWVLVDEQVWRGRINRLGFKRD